MSKEKENNGEHREDVEVIIFAKKFMKMDNDNSSKTKKVNKVVCYNCNKSSHVKYNCPLLKKKKKNICGNLE